MKKSQRLFASPKFTGILGSFFLGSAVLLNAWGAHGLQNKLTPKLIETFKTGATYQLYHGFMFIILAILLQQNSSQNKILSFAGVCYFLGIILFSGNCYLYTLYNLKEVIHYIPLGGIFFVIGHISLGLYFYKKK